MIHALSSGDGQIHLQWESTRGREPEASLSEK